jgi:transcriptional regulator with XRE-family HTH domain
VTEDPPKKLTITEMSTPLFDKDVGSRLRIARMRMLLDQNEFGKLLNVSQQVVSEIERGRLRTSTFTVAQFAEVLGKYFHYVLLGTNPERFETRNVITDYWAKKDAPKGNRTPRYDYSDIREKHGKKDDKND